MASFFPELEFRRDLYVDMSYSMKDDLLTVEDTNVRKDYIDELLSEWIRGQAGRGRDDSAAVERDTYRLRLEVDLSDDTFKMTSDTGNKGLTAGIIMTSIGKLRFSSRLEEEVKAEKTN